LIRQGSSNHYHTQHQGRAHEPSAVRHYPTQAKAELRKRIVNQIKEVILSSPDILELLK